MLFYKTAYGGIISSEDVGIDFHFHTGKYRYEDEQGYLRHLHGLLGTLITGVIVPPFEWRQKTKLEVLHMFRDEHPDWSLSDCIGHMKRCVAEFSHSENLG